MFGVIGGLLMILVGVAIVYAFEYWRLFGKGVQAVIIGVRRRGSQYHTVYQYALPDGGTGEATSVLSSMRLNGRETGRSVPICVLPGYPEQALDASSPEADTLAFAIILLGAVFIYDAASAWRLSPIIWTLLAIVVLFLGRKIWRRLMPYLAKVQSQLGSSDTLKSVPIELAESLFSTPSASPSQVNGANPVRGSAGALVVGLVVLALICIPAGKLLRLRHGVKATGTIVDLKRPKNRLYPQVQFTDRKGATVRFWDWDSDNDDYRMGEHLPVLYLPEKGNKAMVDSGLHNWVSLVPIFIFGFGFTSAGLIGLRKGA